MAITPKSIESHQQDYSKKAWELYSLAELGQWVHLLTKRAEHRTNFAKKDKDLTDASNYLAMMQSKLNEMKTVNIGDFAQAIVKRLADEFPDTALIEIEPSVVDGQDQNVQREPHETVYVSWVVPDDASYTGFADTWNEFIEPAIQAFVRDLEGVETIYELGSPSGLGARTLVTTFENMSVRFTTSYDAHKGMVTTIDIGVPKAAKFVDGKYYDTDTEKPLFIADEKVLDQEDRGKGFPEAAVEHITKLGMEDFRKMYEQDPESLGFPKRNN